MIAPVMVSRSWARFGWLVCVALVAATPAVARRQPAPLTATFKDRDVIPDGVKAAPGCAVAFTELTDERTSPELAGVIWQRAIVSPADAKTWLRAVLAGLATRGMTPQFDVPAAVTARLALKTAWITDSDISFNGNVVLHLQAQARAGGPAIDKSYRGGAVRTAYWSQGVDTMQSAIDGAFADALNKMTPDLKALCGH